MTFFIKYLQEPERVIPAVEIDARAGNAAIQGKVGSIIKAYTDSWVSVVSATVIPYKIESGAGNLAGYFLLDTSGLTPVVMRKVYRPAFKTAALSLQLDILINTFISNGGYKDDQL